MAKWGKLTCLASGSESEWELESGTQGLLFCCCCWKYMRRGNLGVAWTVFATAGAESHCPLSLCMVPSGAEAQTHSQPICLDAGNIPEGSHRCCEEDSSGLMNVEIDFKRCVSSVWKGNSRTSFSSNFLIYVARVLQLGKGVGSFCLFFFVLFLFCPVLLTTIILLCFLISGCWNCNHLTGLKCS